MRHETYIAKCYELDFLRFKEKHGKHTSREICHMIRESLKE